MQSPSPNFALVGDIGGTNARFALADLDTGALLDTAILSAAEYPSLTDAANAFLSRHATRPNAAALAIAAPILGGAIRFTNSPWVCDAARLREELSIENIRLLNDFEALAWSLPHLEAASLHRIGGGEPEAQAAKAVLGPGTGLGVGALARSPAGWIPIPGEGGHVALAAETDREADILKSMRDSLPRVSAERVLSGPGLSDLYAAIATLRGGAERLEPAAIISRARGGADATAREALDLFVLWLGRFAGDVALTFGARGGVYIGGGIAPRILPELGAGSFRAAFEAKGRMSPFVMPIPIDVITSGDAALKGAAAAIAGAHTLSP